MTTIVKRGRGRPRKEDVAEAQVRPTRVPITGNRNVMAVDVKPIIKNNFNLRWVKDIASNGTRIMQFIRGGYTFVGIDDVSSVGSENISTTVEAGSIIRIPAGREYSTAGVPVYLYLMKIPKEFYDEDQAAKQKQISDLENRTESDYLDKGDGNYGELIRE